ncbi:MAG: phage recombination protein Bet [Deltaproteobacteria bacterium]
MNNKNAGINSNDLPYGFNAEQVELIRASSAKDATDDELKLFLFIAQRTGLDPLTKQIHFVKRKIRQNEGSFKSIITVQTGIDGYRAIAERTGQLAGIDDPVYDTEDANAPNKATVTVFKMVNNQRCPFTATARWKEYYPGESHGFMWMKMPYLMLGKCAEALALRKAFPNDLSGIYTNEEMQQADGEDKGEYAKDNKEDKVITEPQRKRLYALANANTDIIRNVSEKYGYETSKDIKVSDYEIIAGEIKEMANTIQ